ncbi:cytochrome c3 family protein, partial [Bilophila wadsworthia]
EDQPCSECHKANMPSGRTPLMRAYHKNCIECHTAQNKGPTTCGACHK